MQTRIAAPLPQAATAAYETLRAAVLSESARPEGLAAVRFHGMVQGLALLLNSAVSPVAPSAKSESISPSVHAHELVHVLANIVLRTHSELAHVY